MSQRYDWRVVNAPSPAVWGTSASRTRLPRALRELGLWGVGSHEKFIPRHLPAGQPDGPPRSAAGAARHRRLGGDVGARFAICTASYRLAKDVVGTGSLRSAAGARSTTSGRLLVPGREARGPPAFVVNIHHPDPRSLFLLSEKRDRLPAAPTRSWKPVLLDRADARRRDAVHFRVAPVPALRHRRLRRHAQHGPRAEHRRARGPGAEAPRPRLLDGNGRRAAGPSHARFRGPRRCAAPSHGPPRYRRLGPPRQRARQAERSAHPDRRDAGARIRWSFAREPAACGANTAAPWA